jgi:hypothetical protein
MRSFQQWQCAYRYPACQGRPPSSCSQSSTSHTGHSSRYADLEAKKGLVVNFGLLRFDLGLRSGDSLKYQATTILPAFPTTPRNRFENATKQVREDKGYPPVRIRVIAGRSRPNCTSRLYGLCQLLSSGQDAREQGDPAAL